MSITAMTCPKCKSVMRWYSSGGYGFYPQWKCDYCGYDTANQTYRASNKYTSGETAALTCFEDLMPITNARHIISTELGGMADQDEVQFYVSEAGRAGA